MNPLDKTLIELSDEIRARRLSPVELMQATLQRIGERNPHLNAVVALREEEVLLQEARAAEDRTARGEARPLEGIPLGVKDLDDVEGMVTTHGSLVFRDYIAKEDSTQVARLRAAGAIVIGKTNAPEFGYTAITKNLVYGVTRSPWDLDRTPGGSSGGSSAAVAGGLLALVTAGDGGGSIRIPASFTGTFGLKTSYGRIPKGPSDYWEYGDTAVGGPLTKTVEDGALFMDLVVGPSPYDPKSLPHPGLSYLSAVRGELPRRLRLGFSPDLGYAVVQSDVAAAVEEAVKVFESCGHRIDLLPDGPPPEGREWGMLGAFELASQLHSYLPEREHEFGRTFARAIRIGTGMTHEMWGQMARSRAVLNLWCAKLFSTYDALLTPTVPYDPPPAKGPFPEEIEGRTQPVAGVASFTIPFNLSWHPAASIRAGMSKAGLPIGLQIVGPRHRDDLVLQLARQFERERPWHPHWPR
ncbi:MAG TPA: amidase [Terriglobales bacterium]|nr:amidase [Terriglobales bacterium]